jgi:hypothetical protein
MGSPKAHWEQIFAATESSDLSWFEAEPTLSLRLVEACRPNAGT